ncbi:coniferyl aldehyde dehydrogenase [Temperatibacter marinus]|uniref:Aldehyde dehydrogenase n=1 Tax=Temperatibacter marinus TaxID=1456591 RepID=A0AA52EG69_9PROT|nr:coniferyl aldehyde dehydrogenase [Temperatibacter marinus]WND01947.1 coniferyl aldehyde dehydrogenase [Temperatibacter marinus]
MDGGIVANEHFEAIQTLLNKQRESYLQEGFVSAAVRIDRLKRAKNLVLKYKDELLDVINEDYGNRSKEIGLVTDVMAANGALADAIKNVKKWMKPEKRGLMFPLGLLGARAQVNYQPKGVMGIITPWNFPLTMIFVPLAQALAAGNRVIIKPSEHTPKTSDFIQKIISESFDETEVAVYTGGVEVSQAFASQNWDHLMFTGAPVVGKLIMRAASENLVPVTLELGGKSPVLVSRGADLKMVAERVATWKMTNAGQICLTADYINLPEDKKDEFIEVYKQTVSEMFPTLLENDQYTSIITERHRDRMHGYLKECEDKGATVHTINPAKEDFSQQPEGMNKVAPAIIEGVDDSFKIMQEEIFGPLLPIRTYSKFEEVIDYVNDHERPLAIYYFGTDKAEIEVVSHHTTSGGLTINDCVWHGAHETLPFGGVGNSGMGRYHGFDGFKEFSHHKPVLKHPAKIGINKLLGIVPPYGATLKRTAKMELKK